MSGRLRSPLAPSISAAELAAERKRRKLPPYAKLAPRLYQRSEHEGDDRFEALLEETETARGDFPDVGNFGKPGRPRKGPPASTRPARRSPRKP